MSKQKIQLLEALGEAGTIARQVAEAAGAEVDGVDSAGNNLGELVQALAAATARLADALHRTLAPRH